MAHQSSTFRVWKFVERRRCRWCRRPVAMRTTDQNKRFLFELDAPVLRVDEHPVTLVKYDVLEATALHSRHCPKGPDRRRAAQAKKRRATRFAAQGRLL
jgi:hypothetical protein